MPTLRSQRVVTPSGVRPADVVVEGGVIVEVREPVGVADEDFGALALLPGAVDAHVHINEPGRTSWEGFETATRAAAAAGTTTLVDMPLNSIPSTIDVASLDAKIAATAGKLRCDVGFWGGVVPTNSAQLEPLWNAGVLGFKAFMVPSGVDEFEWVGESALREAAPLLARLGAPLLAHCEVPGPIEAASRALADRDWRDHDTWLASRPPAAEVDAIEALIAVAEETGPKGRGQRQQAVAVHVVHLATELGLPVIRAAQARGVAVTVETCVHYLTFAAEDVPCGAVEYKCAPPIRGAATREALWDALRAGEVAFVTTDHSPCPPALKTEVGRFDQAWGGIASIELFRAALWTEARARGCDLQQLARWSSEAPAAFANLPRKGRLQAGFDADLVVFDPDARWTVDASALQHRHPVTPYDGRTLIGRNLRTYLRGEVVFDHTAHEPFGDPVGHVLLRQ